MMRLTSVVLLVAISVPAFAQQGGNAGSRTASRPIPPRSNTVERRGATGNGWTDLVEYYRVLDLIQAEDHWSALEMRGDALLLEEHLSDHFRFTGADGKHLDRDAYLRGFFDRTLVVESLKKTEMSVLRLGPVAVVTGVATLKATRSGTSVHVRFRFTDTFHEEDDSVVFTGKKTWRPVASQRTAIEDLRGSEHATNP
jgi:hypothetical protein